MKTRSPVTVSVRAKPTAPVVVTVRFWSGVVWPTSDAKLTCPVPASIVRLYAPSRVFWKVTLPPWVAIVVSRGRITAPVKVTLSPWVTMSWSRVTRWPVLILIAPPPALAWSYFTVPVPVTARFTVPVPPAVSVVACMLPLSSVRAIVPSTVVAVSTCRVPPACA